MTGLISLAEFRDAIQSIKDSGQNGLSDENGSRGLGKVQIVIRVIEFFGKFSVTRQWMHDDCAVFQLTGSI